jgi:hypothetical protein
LKSRLLRWFGSLVFELLLSTLSSQHFPHLFCLNLHIKGRNRCPQCWRTRLHPPPKPLHPATLLQRCRWRCSSPRELQPPPPPPPLGKSCTNHPTESQELLRIAHACYGRIAAIGGIFAQFVLRAQSGRGRCDKLSFSSAID